MIEYLHKYTQIRECFFEEPMLRATPLNELNDPFEGAVTEGHIKMINNKDIEDSLDFVRLDLEEIGILSFTEEALSPIMWAHYANEHKGMVIQLKADEPFLLGASKLANPIKDYFGLLQESPKPIKYSRYRKLYEFEKEISIAQNNSYQYAQLNTKLLYTKANEWMYEKEHRSVLFLKNADIIICDKDEQLYRFCSKYPEITIDIYEENKYKISYPLNYELEEEMGDESVRFEISLIVKFLHPMYFYKINPDSISAIIFGCKIDLEDLYKYISLIKRCEHKYELYQTKVMKDRYELELLRLDEDII